jgi:hypothetical protein
MAAHPWVCNAPTGQPNIKGSSASRASSATPFMKPASTGCGTNLAKRTSPDSPSAIWHTPMADDGGGCQGQQQLPWQRGRRP